MGKFPFIKQFDSMDCGPACLRMIAKYYGKKIPNHYLQTISKSSKIGTSIQDLLSSSEALGFNSMAIQVNSKTLKEKAPLPCVLYWNQNHYVVLYKVKGKKLYVADPAKRLVSFNQTEFESHWISSEKGGVAILLEPTAAFFDIDVEETDSKGKTLMLFLNYLNVHKKLLFQLFLGLLAGSALSLILPFLTQAIVDVGIQYDNIQFIYLILIAQLGVFLGNASINIIRSWILIHISTRLNIAIISDFFLKLMRLPMSFFDRKNLGDIIQRIRDHDRIKIFLTSSSLQTLFSLVNLLIYSIVLFLYDLTVFFIFIGGSITYIVWIQAFLSKRLEIDYKKFNASAEIQSNEIQLVQGMQEIKLNQAERFRKGEWQSLQAKMFKYDMSSLIIDQWQAVGSSLVNELKNIFIIFVSAQKVIEGEMTLGMMLAVTQIVGILNTPLLQLLGFIRHAQNAKIGLDRLSDIHNMDDEDPQKKETIEPEKGDIEFKDVSFQYENGVPVLQSLSFEIPKGKTTAIVGVSGSGKTTLLKLLLKFYNPDTGKILVNGKDLSQVKSSSWRKKCGVVMQEGYIFSDSIANNISMAGPHIHDPTKIDDSLAISNIKEFADDLPAGINTIIGSSGVGLSTGQKQRFMIARAIYKNPDYIFFDEATSSLDTNNEKNITRNLDKFLKDKTAVIIAHRLSTVRNADQIIVLDKGKIIEKGTHNDLINVKGFYFHLVKNQLELN